MACTGGFSLAIVPDTQELSSLYPQDLVTLARWIADHAEAYNIRLVLHLGDLANSGAAREPEFANYRPAAAVLQAAGLPFIVAIGNHDYDNLLKEDRTATMFNKYCHRSLYEGQPWFGGWFAPGQTENIYGLFDLDGERLLVLSLEFGPRDEVLAWADGVLAAHRDRRAIVITHSYMYLGGRRTRPGDAHNPKAYPGATGANDGEDMWNKCLKHHGNLFMVFSGHHIDGYLSYRYDLGDRGNLVFQSFQNWQYAPHGGEGRIRLVQIWPEENLVRLSVVNTLRDEFETAPGSELCFPYRADAVKGTYAGVRFPVEQG